jgi:hypothetical protein
LFEKNNFSFFFRAQIDELQKKQDYLNSFKNSKLYSNTGVTNSKEAYGESPSKRSLPTVKSSRSSSFNRPNIKRVNTVKIFLISNKNFFFYV